MRWTLICATVLLVSITGCKKGSFLQQNLDDFTAYYNRFYNARESFEAALENLERGDQAIDRSVYLPLFSGSGSRGGSFEQVIKKCADLLRGHPNSKWADDAILLIGKSYYYQQEYVGAEQKFREVINVSNALEDEARFWLGRTLIANNAFSEALTHLEESIQREGVNDRWVAQMKLALSELYVRQGDWETAATALQEALPEVSNGELASRGEFLLGQVLQTLGKYEEAAAAFARVRHFKPLYPLMFASMMSQAEVEGLYLDADEGLQLVRRMQRDDKFYDDRAQVNLLRGRILAKWGNPEDAYFTFEDLLYNRDSNGGSLRGNIHYALGELYEERYRDFLLASTHYDTAATNIRVARTDDRPLFTTVAIVDAQEKSTNFKKFATAAKKIIVIDSLLWLGGLEEAEFDSVIAQVKRQREEEARALQEEVERRQREERFLNIDRGPGGSRQNTRGFAEAGQNRDAGFLFYQDPVLVQEARQKFREEWGDRPLAPNWRRSDVVRGGFEPTGAASDSLLAANGGAQDGESGITIDVSTIPRDPEARTEARRERAGLRYEVANVLFLSMSRPDSAAAWYRQVIEEDNEFPVAARAYYALAEVQRALGDDENARRLYQEIIESYPQSDFTVRARERLGLPVDESLIRPDSLALAEEAYQTAYSTWKGNSHDKAFSDMLRVAKDFSETPVAARALLAAGQIYTEWASGQGVDLLNPVVLEVDSLLFDQGPIAPSDTTATDVPEEIQQSLIPNPLALTTIYQSIQTHFPNTPYSARAKLIADGLNQIKTTREELAAREQARRDSLLAATLIPDSTWTITDSTWVITDSTWIASDSTWLATDSTWIASDSTLTVTYPDPPPIAEAVNEPEAPAPDSARTDVGRLPETDQARAEQVAQDTSVVSIPAQPDLAQGPPPLDEPPDVRQEIPPDSSGIQTQTERVPEVVQNVAPCRIVTELNSVYFDLQRSDLDDQAKELLDENLELLLQCPDIFVTIRAYSDSVEDSVPISGQRAESVRSYYQSAGLAVDRIRLVQGLGKAPVECAKEDPGEGCRVNRRAESVPGS